MCHIGPQEDNHAPASLVTPSLVTLPKVLVCVVLSFLHHLTDRTNVEFTCRYLKHCSGLKQSWPSTITLEGMRFQQQSSGIVNIFREYARRLQGVKLEQLVVKVHTTANHGGYDKRGVYFWKGAPTYTDLSTEVGKLYQNFETKGIVFGETYLNIYAFLHELKTLKGLERLVIEQNYSFEPGMKSLVTRLSSLRDFSSSHVNQAGKRTCHVASKLFEALL